MGDACARVLAAVLGNDGPGCEGELAVEAGEFFAGDGAIVPWLGVRGEDEGGLCAFASDQDQVIWRGVRKRSADRLTAVGLFNEAVAGVGAAHRRGDVGDDLRRVFGAGVLTGEVAVVGELGGDLTHRGAAGRVTLAGDAEDQQQTPCHMRADGFERNAQRGTGRGGVDDHVEGLARVDRLHASGNGSGIGEAALQRDGAGAERPGRADGERCVAEVEISRQIESAGQRAGCGDDAHERTRGVTRERLD